MLFNFVYLDIYIATESESCVHGTPRKVGLCPYSLPSQKRVKLHALALNTKSMQGK